MLETAVAEIGLSPSEFWDLSWYEWGLYLLRLKSRRESEHRGWEQEWDRMRTLLVTLRRVNGDKTVKPKDIIELSFDKHEIKEISKGDIVKKFKPTL